MDIKHILQDPHAAIKKRWGSLDNCTESVEIVALAEAIASDREEIKRAKTDKQLCSKQFKDSLENEEIINGLKARMQEISMRLKKLEAEKKHRENRLLEFFSENAQGEQQKLPRQFTIAEPPMGSSAETAISISSVEDKRQEAWDEYVDRHAQASLYHRYAWRNVVEQSFGHPSIYLAAFDPSNRIIGILPMVWTRSRLFGNYGTSMPYFNYGGPLADSPRIVEKLLDRAAELAASYQWQHLEVRTCSPGYGWPCQSRKASMLLALPGSGEQLDQSIGTKLRAQIKAALPHQPEIFFGGRELLDDFYRVFAQNMRDLGTPVYSKMFFANILADLPDQATIVLVKVNRKPVATAFLMGNRDMLEIPWASTLRRANPMNINMWMYRQILGYAIDQGYAFFDFGRSTIDTGTYRFKKQWGARPVVHYWYYWLAEGEALPALNPDNPKYRLAIGVWQRLPVWLTRIIGPGIVKNLS